MKNNICLWKSFPWWLQNSLLYTSNFFLRSLPLTGVLPHWDMSRKTSERHCKAGLTSRVLLFANFFFANRENKFLRFNFFVCAKRFYPQIYFTSGFLVPLFNKQRYRISLVLLPSTCWRIRVTSNLPSQLNKFPFRKVFKVCFRLESFQRF